MTRRTHLAALLNDTLEAAKQLPVIERQLAEWRRGAPGANYNPNNTGVTRYDHDENGNRIPIGAPSDPTGETATSRTQDPIRQLEERIDRDLVDARRTIDDLLRAFNEILRPLEHRTRSCVLHDSTDVWRPAHTTIPNGNRRIPVCRWCSDFHKTNGRPPTPREVDLNAQGRQVRTSSSPGADNA